VVKHSRQAYPTPLSTLEALLYLFVLRDNMATEERILAKMEQLKKEQLENETFLEMLKKEQEEKELQLAALKQSIYEQECKVRRAKEACDNYSELTSFTDHQLQSIIQSLKFEIKRIQDTRHLRGRGIEKPMEIRLARYEAELLSRILDIEIDLIQF
jgi:hypothetical protein